MSNHGSETLTVGILEPSQRAKTLTFAAIIIGVLTFGVGIFKYKEDVWPAYLLGYFYFVGLALGAMFFVAIQHIVKAGWSPSIRRMAESMTSFLPAILVGGTVLVMGLRNLYPWADFDRVSEDHLLQVKAGYLNPTFFILRIVLFGGGSWLFSKLIVGNSVEQDKTGDPELTHKNVGLSVAYIPFFAILFSLFTVDVLMALHPHWYSTIFGIYCFAGIIQAFFAMMILLTFWLKNSGVAKGFVTFDHIHDLGKFMKGFTVFWAYIAFSQFMLIWYANIPEETEFYLMRAQNGWMFVSLLLLVFRFIIPFVALLPRWAKRTESYLKIICVGVLVMQFVDLYWLIYPNFFDNHVKLNFIDIGIFIGFGGMFFAGIFNFLAKIKPVAEKDPRMHEALAHHVTY
jgi:hypothetical protein